MPFARAKATLTSYFEFEYSYKEKVKLIFEFTSAQYLKKLDITLFFTYCMLAPSTRFLISSILVTTAIGGLILSTVSKPTHSLIFISEIIQDDHIMGKVKLYALSMTGVRCAPELHPSIQIVGQKYER